MTTPTRNACKLLCLGERGTCPCDGPDDCLRRNRPDFSADRLEAEARMARVIRAAVAKRWEGLSEAEAHLAAIDAILAEDDQ